VDRAVRWLDQRRLPAIFLSRWLVSALCPYVNVAAGAARIAWPRFTLPALAGTCIWVSVYVGLGYSFSAHIQELGSVLGNLAAAIASGVVAALIGRALWRGGAESRD
jgi:membrane protein DedA with SNARE-associated domain